MPDTIFYTLKLKRTKTPMEVFEKMQKSVKKKGPTKNWICTVDNENERMEIDFGDGESETFTLDFKNKIANDCCKVYFPLEGELFDDEKKSEFKALLNMIYSAKAMFSEIIITDDFGLAEDFMQSKYCKITLRELDNIELERARKVFGSGYTDHNDFIMAIIYDLLGIPFEDDYRKHINPKVSLADAQKKLQPFDPLNAIYERQAFFETFLYETSEYKGQGRLSQVPDYRLNDMSDVMFSVFAFISGIEELYLYKNYYYKNDNRSFGAKHGQVRRLYKTKFLPLLERECDDFKKCVLTYCFFVSVYDYCGFKFAGRETTKKA